jgi:hypothetical protein
MDMIRLSSPKCETPAIRTAVKQDDDNDREKAEVEDEPRCVTESKRAQSRTHTRQEECARVAHSTKVKTLILRDGGGLDRVSNATAAAETNVCGVEEALVHRLTRVELLRPQ